MAAPKNERGVSLVASTFLFVTEQARLHDYALECSPRETSILDIEGTTQLFVKGGQFWIARERPKGDLAHFSVVDKNNILGLHTRHNSPLGFPIELVAYVKDYDITEIGSDGNARPLREHDKDGRPVSKRKARDLDPALTPNTIERLIHDKQKTTTARYAG